MENQNLGTLCTAIRHNILRSTTAAGSGHPTSSLSATELMTVLLFGNHFRYDIENPDYDNNDRLIFSKGHASPLFYALWAMAGKISPEELLTLRQFESRLEGHPTMILPYTEAATGSRGQGLSIGVGFALNAMYLDKLPYRTYVLLGDSEMAEGSLWEAMQLASHYKLDNLVGIIDVNRLGQRGETMSKHDVDSYQKKVAAFGWETIIIDGHKLEDVDSAYKKASQTKGRPTMIIAKTIKGQGVSFLADKNGWHGKALTTEDLKKALQELGPVDAGIQAKIQLPEKITAADNESNGTGEATPTRKAYGNALKHLAHKYPKIVVLDGETSNSTYSEIFKEVAPERFFEMYIAEQNMVGAALGFSRRNKIPFVSTFAAFLTRAFDQIRMSQYSNANIKFVGSHGGVSVGEDGSSQMGLEDMAMFRTLLNGVVLYPSDAYATEKLVEEAAKHRGIVYIRTTRNATALLYGPQEEFPIGGSKLIRYSKDDTVTVVAAGITLYEALKAHEVLKKEGIMIRVVDLYSIKPIDRVTLQRCASETKAIVTVEDHFAEGGLGEAVAAAVSTEKTPLHIMAVRKMPKSGKADQLLRYEEISSETIIQKVKTIYYETKKSLHKNFS